MPDQRALPPINCTCGLLGATGGGAIHPVQHHPCCAYRQRYQPPLPPINFGYGDPKECSAFEDHQRPVLIERRFGVVLAESLPPVTEAERQMARRIADELTHDGRWYLTNQVEPRDEDEYVGGPVS